jgi:hypothetical protein
MFPSFTRVRNGTAGLPSSPPGDTESRRSTDRTSGAHTAISPFRGDLLVPVHVCGYLWWWCGVCAGLFLLLCALLFVYLIVISWQLVIMRFYGFGLVVVLSELLQMQHSGGHDAGCCRPLFAQCERPRRRTSDERATCMDYMSMVILGRCVYVSFTVHCSVWVFQFRGTWTRSGLRSGSRCVTGRRSMGGARCSARGRDAAWARRGYSSWARFRSWHRTGGWA